MKMNVLKACIIYLFDVKEEIIANLVQKPNRKRRRLGSKSITGN